MRRTEVFQSCCDLGSERRRQCKQRTRVSCRRMGTDWAFGSAVVQIGPIASVQKSKRNMTSIDAAIASRNVRASGQRSSGGSSNR